MAAVTSFGDADIEHAVKMYIHRLCCRVLSPSVDQCCLTPLPKSARASPQDESDSGKGMTPFLECLTPPSIARVAPLAELARCLRLEMDTPMSSDDDVLLFENCDATFCSLGDDTPNAAERLDLAWDCDTCFGEGDMPHENKAKVDSPSVENIGHTSSSSSRSSSRSSSPTKQLQERLSGGVRESLSLISDKGGALSSAFENLSCQMEDTLSARATTLKEKASNTLVKGKASAEETAMRRSIQLEELFDAKVALLEDKARSTLGESKYSALESSALRCSQRFDEGVNQRVTAIADKTKSAAVLFRSASEDFAASPRHFQGILKQKSAVVAGKTKSAAATLRSKSAEKASNLRSKSAEKTRSTYSAFDSSATRYSQQLEGIVHKRTAAVTGKTKAAASLVRNRSEELASTALLKSGELVSSTRGKLKAAGQDGLRALAKSIPFQHGGG